MTAWTAQEQDRIAAGAAAAPSVHNTQPWLLGFQDGFVSLRERRDRSLPRQDPRGRDRLISCGAALEHVRLTIRVLGRVPDVELRDDPADPDEVARVVTTRSDLTSDVDLWHHRAITARHSHRRPFVAEPVGEHLRRRLLGVHAVDGVDVRPITGSAEFAALAELLHDSALVLRADREYQRELAAWTATDRRPAPGGGVPAVTGPVSTLPWAGLVRLTTAVPDTGFLADRLSREFLVLVHTPADNRRDHLLAGMAAEQTWLAATDAGLAGSALTQPFQLPAIRSGLVEALSLSGFPQVLLRFGHSRGDRRENR